LHLLDSDTAGYEWINGSDADYSVIAFMRKCADSGQTVIIVCNFTPMPRQNYRIGAPSTGFWKEILNSDAKEYWGSGQGNAGGVEAVPVPWHGRHQSLSLTLPPLAILFFKQRAQE